MPRRHPLLLPSTAFLLFSLASCGDVGPVGPDMTGLEIVVVQGEGQAAEPGALLPTALQVRVQEQSTGRGRADVRVRWELVTGGGGLLDPPEARTDSTGLASSRLTLGPALGAYTVQARIPGAADLPPVEFQAEAILYPELTLVPPGAVRAGDTILLEGKNLSPTPSSNVVTFSGVPGRVLSSSGTDLRVEVPDCLPAREVLVQVRIGTLTTTTAPLRISGGTRTLVLARGEDRLLSSAQGPVCVHLSGESGERYLAVPHSTGLVGGAVYSVTLVGLASDGLSPPLPAPSRVATSMTPPSRLDEPEDLPLDLEHPLGAQGEWDLVLRRLEAELVATRGFGGAPSGSWAAGLRTPGAAPVVGETRKFKVLNRKREFDNVTAVLRVVGDRSLVYVDQKAPAGGFAESDLAFLADEFDATIHPAVTDAFGVESDLDGNGRVVILLTPTVNQLTDGGSDGYVGGFFFGLDLMPGESGSNGGEIFYALVPDPQGELGPPLSRNAVLAAVPAVLAHEFGHMVHHNQRFLLSGAEHAEALWLSEAMAQMAEDQVGALLEARGAFAKAVGYREGNWLRAHRFLRDPNQVSVLASLPPGTLAERGAGWLFLKQISGQLGPEYLLGRLARSTKVGVANLTERVGKEWGELLAEWAGSLFLDELSIPVRPELTVPGIDLRWALSRFDGSYPLSAPILGGSSFAQSLPLWSSAADYFIMYPPHTGGLALSVSGPGGRPPDASMALQLLVVRIQ